MATQPSPPAPPQPTPPPPPPPPETLGRKPDKHTRQAPDYTGDHADGRVLRLETRWFKYGTDDKGHAAAIILSILLLLMLLISVFIGALVDDRTWLVDMTKWVSHAFMLSAGVAIGKSMK